jgi:hypothetical protein
MRYLCHSARTAGPLCEPAMLGIKTARALRAPFLASLSAMAPLFAGAQAPTPPPDTFRQGVIVELFTAEGCSSCPPADALLAQLEEQQPFGNAAIIALEEHVDYWDRQGWTDPFGSSQWTLRQQVYVALFKEGAAYTPQMVVDGQSQLIGSHALEAQQVLSAAARQRKTPVSISAAPDPGVAQQFAVTVGRLVGASGGDTAEVWLAVTEAGLHSLVKRGENAGADLHHAAIVRTLRKIGVADGSKDPVTFQGSHSVMLKPAWNRSNLRVVAFVQEKKSHRILGAASIKSSG